MARDIEKYSDITDEDCVYYSGETLKDMYSRSNGFHQLRFESVKDNMREKQIYHPFDELEDKKMYKCFEYSRVSGAYIEYSTIAILNL